MGPQLGLQPIAMPICAGPVRGKPQPPFNRPFAQGNSIAMIVGVLFEKPPKNAINENDKYKKQKKEFGKRKS